MKQLFLVLSLLFTIDRIYAQCSFEPIGPDDLNQASYSSAYFTSLTVDANGTPYIAHMDTEAATYYTTATVMKFDGSKWVNVGSPKLNSVINPSLAVDVNGTPYIAYADGDKALRATVKKFDGTNWINVGSPGFSAGASAYTSLVIAPDGIPYVAFQDYGTSGKARVMKFDGANWVNISGVGLSTSLAWYTSLAVGPNGMPYVAYMDWGNSRKATVMKFDGANWVNVGDAGFSPGNADFVSLTITANGTPYIAFQDHGGAGRVMKFDGADWVNIGNAGFSEGVNSHISLSITANGTPYVAYRDAVNSDKATVRKFDGVSWTNVGNAGFSWGAVKYTSLIIATDGTPYVAYADAGNADKATVMTLKENNWSQIGTTGFSTGLASHTSLAINGEGAPYVAFQDHGNSSKATVMKFDGFNWVDVGGAGFSAGAINYPSLALAPTGTPYIAYKDAGNSDKATVMKFDGFNWVNVGNSGFSTGAADYISLVINANGTPYIAFQDQGNAGKARVMKFDGANWANVGNAGLSPGYAHYISLAIAPDGTPYIAYKDIENFGSCRVIKFDGTGWVTVGFSSLYNSGAADHISLAIAPNGTPYIVYSRDVGTTFQGRAYVLKFNGEYWERVGNSHDGISSGSADHISLVISTNGTPYIAYRELPSDSYQRLSLVKFDGSNWLNVGNPSAGTTTSASLVLDKTGTPIIAYTSGRLWTRKLTEDLTTGNTSYTTTIQAPFSGLFKKNCEVIATVLPNGDNPISGSTHAKVWIDAAQPNTFVKRHYEITPVYNAATATGYITLYFTQEEFDDFNAVNSVQLPTGPSDSEGKSNLVIEKRNGNSSDNSGLPNTYPGTVVTLDPSDDNIIWNSTSQRWEVSFDVTGFSGFFIRTSNGALPIRLVSLAVKAVEDHAQLVWEAADAVNFNRFEIERSPDAKAWKKVGEVMARDESKGTRAYFFSDYHINSSSHHIIYYRLKMLDKDGTFSYSTISSIDLQKSKESAFLYPNPVSDRFYLRVGHTGNEVVRVHIDNLLGQTVLVASEKLDEGIPVKQLPSGLYIASTIDGNGRTIGAYRIIVDK